MKLKQVVLPVLIGIPTAIKRPENTKNDGFLRQKNTTAQELAMRGSCLTAIFGKARTNPKQKTAKLLMNFKHFA